MASVSVSRTGRLPGTGPGKTVAEGSHEAVGQTAHTRTPVRRCDGESVYEVSGGPWKYGPGNPSAGERRGVGKVKLVGVVARTHRTPRAGHGAVGGMQRGRRHGSHPNRDRRRTHVAVVHARAGRATVLPLLRGLVVPVCRRVVRGRARRSTVVRRMRVVLGEDRCAWERVVKGAVAETQGLTLGRRDEHDGEQEGDGSTGQHLLESHGTPAACV